MGFKPRNTVPQGFGQYDPKTKTFTHWDSLDAYLKVHPPHGRLAWRLRRAGWKG